MRPQNGVLAMAEVLLVAWTCLAEERGAKESPSGRPGPQACAAAAPLEQRALIAAFLADTERRQSHDFPAWNQFREIVGDTPHSRAIFSDMLRAEPELLAAVAGEPKQLGQVLTDRVRTLERASRSKRDAARMENILAVALAASRVDAV